MQNKSGRADSNRRRPAWEADILPLNYARKTVNIESKSKQQPAVLSSCFLYNILLNLPSITEIYWPEWFRRMHPY
jgi:hypothetical protein